MSWYLEVLKKYAVFDGRARRKEYWYFFLFNNIIGTVLIVIDGMTGSFSTEVGIGLLSGIYLLAVLIPGVAVSVRRLHDTNRYGWWLLIGLIPFGVIVLLVFMLQDSTPGENQYGSNPKGVAAKPIIKAKLLPSERVCNECGEKYKSSDYNPDALEWLCSACKRPLPRE